MRSRVIAIIEVLILSVLLFATRCANHDDVFVGGNILFTDGDCYARMTRVRLCAQHPGLIVRHHYFENFPEGTTSHTTAPFDYLILGLSILLKPFSARSIDLAGAFVSPVLGVAAGWFLWWWSRRMNLRFRWALLILFAISPILVHGAELGRPDHQSLLILLMSIALCAEWTLGLEDSTRWSVVSGIAWGLAIWVSAYEPLLLLLVLIFWTAITARKSLAAPQRRIGWICFGGILLLALLIERRIPSLRLFQPASAFYVWSRNIGELQSISPFNWIWFEWVGWLILAVPFLIWLGVRKRQTPPAFIIVLLLLTFLLTVWQARWSYFFVLLFACGLTGLLEPIKRRSAAWVVFAISILPILNAWEEKIWPNEAEAARRIEQRYDALELRSLALELIGQQRQPFLAPWWLSAEIAYWSGQPGVAGSSHESLAGIIDSARFFLSQDPATARQIAQSRQITWVLAYDSDRVEKSSAALLGASIPPHPLIKVLDQRPGQVPPFLVFSAQNGTGKLYRIRQ